MSARDVAQPELDFHGATYDPTVDGPRLRRQLQAVLTVMLDGRWRTLSAIARDAAAPEASVSARLRDLRKPAFGAWIVERRRRAPEGGTWEYRVHSPQHEEDRHGEEG